MSKQCFSFPSLSSSLLLIALLAGTQAAAAEGQDSTVCAPRAQLLDQLSSRYKEVPVAVGLSTSGSLIEILTSDNGGTWTIMVSRPNGSSCLVASGEGWEELKRVANNERGA
jgi:hypothetical protein